MNHHTLRRAVGYLAQHKGKMALAMLCALGQVLLFLLSPVLIGRAIDQMIGVGQVNFTAVARILLLAMGTVVAGGAGQWAMQAAAQGLSAQTAREIRRQAFARLNETPLKKLDTRPRGDIASRLVNDADALAEGFLQAISQLLPGVATILATIVVMLVLNWAIALVVIVTTPLSIVFAQFVGRRTARFFRRMSEEQGKMSAYVGEAVRGQDILQDYGYEGRSLEEFEHLNARYSREYRKAVLYSSIINPGTRLVNAIVVAAVAVLGGIYAIMGGITVGGLSVFLNYATQYTRPFNEVTAVLTQMQTAFAGAERLFEVIDWPQEPLEAEGALAPTHAEGLVQARAVYFSYAPEKPLIQDFSLTVNPGRRVALVGPTGCGKTTLINLFMRFYELDSGEISVDGNGITALRRGALRGLYGMVLQDSWLKQATVRENIAYGRPDASEADIIEAAREALAHGFIKRLPKGYDTVLKTGGAGLSAGEKQLLCIARIMLAKPDMLILDEATSSIDTRTELLVQQAMDRLMQGHTSFIVAHRLSTIQNADEILVMNAGRVIERGGHRELLARGGFYTKLYNSQFGGQGAEG